jgi:APA family basic amino acid/polyamine antiporter
VSQAPVSQRKLDPFGGVALVVGSILGSGIFIAPRLVASFSGSLWVAALFWIVGGLVCTAGALIYGGLGLLYPQGGGQYIYLRESMGPRYAKFYGWVSMLIICPTMLAGTSLFFTELCQGVVPGIAPVAKAVAIGLIVLFTLFNTIGLKLAGSVQKILVVAHVALFIGVMILSSYFLPGHQLISYASEPIALTDLNLGKGVLALAAVLWSFEGFNTITFLTNEVEGGEKNVRRIALWGCAIVLVLYLAFNVITLSNIPQVDLLKQANAASYLMSSVFGARASWIVFALTALGVASVLHSSIIIGPRVIAATVKDGNTLKSLGSIHPETGVPSHALWFQCAVAGAYVLVGHFDVLITAFIVLNWLFYGLTAIGYIKIKLRLPSAISRHMADVSCVVLFVSMVAILLVSQFIENTQVALIGIACFIVGVYVPPPKSFAYLLKSPRDWAKTRDTFPKVESGTFTPAQSRSSLAAVETNVH